MAAKRTSELIPLCHPLPLSHVDVVLTPAADGYDIEARARTTAQTGVEMEALTAVSVAALTVYDMVKAVDKTMVIGADPTHGEARGAFGGLAPGMKIVTSVYSDPAWTLPEAEVDRLRRGFRTSPSPTRRRARRACANWPTPTWRSSRT